MIRLLVVDDHPVVREGLAAVLGDRPDLEVAGTAASAEEALVLIRDRNPDVVLLDLELPGMNGVAAVPALLAAAPRARIVVFTAHGTDEQVLGAVRAGVHGYLLKGAAAEEIASAIRAVHAGGSYLEPTVAAKLMAQVGPGPPPPLLTPREAEVLRCVADGRSNKQIARLLAISERTVKFHLGAVFRKLGAENRTQAVTLAARRGALVPAPPRNAPPERG